MTAFYRNGWRAKFVLNGRQIWVPGSPFPSESAAIEAEKRHRDYLQARRTEETCASFAERWLEEWPRKAEATRRTYAAAAKRFAEHFGPTPLGDIEHINARAWALTVPRGISRVVSIMYEDARNVGLVKDNPFARLRLPLSEKRVEVRPPTMEEYRALLDACMSLGGYGQEFKAMIQVSAWVGLRAGELHGLQWEDIGEETIRIERARQRDGSLGAPKNGYARTVIFPPPARVLEQVPRRPDPFVFHSPRGNPLVQGSHHYVWRTVRAAAGLPDLRWHSLRHFCATQLLELGVDHFAVSVQLGHRDGGNLVMARYGHPSEDAARDRLLGAFNLRTTDLGGSRVASEGRR